MIRIIVLAGLLGFAFVSGALAEVKSYLLNPKYEVRQVLGLAEEHAKGEKFQLDKYVIDYVKYESSEKKWIVHFQGRMLEPGNDFMVWLDESNGKMNLMRGE